MTGIQIGLTKKCSEFFQICTIVMSQRSYQALVQETMGTHNIASP